MQVNLVMRTSKSTRFIFPFILLTAMFIMGQMPTPNDYISSYIGTLKHKSSSEITNSPWGIQVGSLEKDHVDKAAQIGIKWTRLQLSWDQVEKSKGVYNWGASDTAFEMALQRGITPFISLCGSNKLYCKEAETDARQKELYGISPIPPTADSLAMKAWLTFIKKAIERYKEKISYWEIWNEPNHPHYWGAAPSGAEYGKLVSATSDVIKSVDSKAKIIGGALAGLDPEFTANFLANGVAKKIDILSFHNYAELPEDRIYKAIETWDVINKFNPSLELWQGECGYPSSSSTRDYRGTSPWGVTIQAKWLLRQAFTDVFFCRTTMSNYFKLVHQGGRGDLPKRSFLTAVDSVLGFPAKGGSRVKSVGVNEKCILQNPTLTPKPAFDAYRNLCSVFDSRYKVKKMSIKIEVLDQGNFYGIGSEDDAFPSIPLSASFRSATGSNFIAYWLPWHPQELIKEATVRISVEGTKFKHPVLVDILTGKVFNLNYENSKSGTFVANNIPLADYPFAIVEQNEIVLSNE